MRTLLALAVTCVTLVLPYRARALWLNAVAAAVHLPYKLFGRLARHILAELEAR